MQPNPRLLSPGALSSRYGPPWQAGPPQQPARQPGRTAAHAHNSSGESMASTPEDSEDSGRGPTVNNSNPQGNSDSHSRAVSDRESQVVRHIDRNILSCQICQNRFREPKVLPCLHTFCLGCLPVYLPPQSLTLTCPLCGQQSILPRPGVS